MYLLAIETTGAFASVALAKAENANGHVESFEIVGHIDGHDRFSHLQNLTPQIEQVLADNGLSIGDVSVIAVSCGPGSFTGIRIGVSTARALSQALDIPCVPVSSLEAMALRQKTAEGETADCRKIICPIIDARRSQVYGGGYGVDTDEVQPVEMMKAGPYTVEEFMDEVKENTDRSSDIASIIFMGDGIDKYLEQIEDLKEAKGLDIQFEYAAEQMRYQDADTVALLGAELAAAGRTCGFEELEPEYMRLAEAERKLKEKQKNG